MSDINMCLNKECAKRASCYRFTALVNEYRQSYADFKLDENGECEDFWDNSGS